MRRIVKAVSIMGIVLLTGCADMHPGWMGRSGLAPSGDYYMRDDLDELLRFGADMARKSASARAEECRWLVKRHGNSPGLRLHLLAGRLLSEACGDKGRVIDGVSALPRGAMDRDVQWLAAAQMEALRRSGGSSCPPCAAGGSGGSKRSADKTDRKAKGAPAAPAASSPPAAPAAPAASPGKKDEARILREKLEAIRSMERKLDKTSGDN